tara:strand:+ start:316 stop:729 length:414 start_codon:yes stop_codon:yes gene_type:complete
MASCTKCERKPTNTGCPVFNMDDGRHFTTYVSRCVLNNNVSGGNAMNSYEYRMYLQHNAEKIMNENKNVAGSNNKCEPCFDFNEDGTMVPELNKFECNANMCTLKDNNSSGIGTGRNHNVVKMNVSNAVTKENFMRF